MALDRPGFPRPSSDRSIDTVLLLFRVVYHKKFGELNTLWQDADSCSVLSYQRPSINYKHAVFWYMSFFHMRAQVFY